MPRLNSGSYQMRRSSLRVAGYWLVLLASCAMACADQPAGNEPSKSTWPAMTQSADTGPRVFVSEHRGVFNGKKVSYRATVAETIIKDPSGNAVASMFTFAYTAKGVKEPTSRPVLFVFNGGPGGASVALHFGALGPKRMEKFTGPAQADPNTRLIDNPYTVLDVADLVFIDPVDTGYSQLLPGAKAGLFHSVDGDSYAITELIVHWLSANGRLGSPKYLLGESYGSLRAVALTRDLAAATPKVDVDGIVLVSQAIRYNGPSSLSGPHDLNPLRAITRLPDVAALAWYHGKIDNKGQTVQEAMEKARVFARTGYAEALLLGNRLDEAGRARIAARLAALTGLSTDYLLAHNLRVGDYRHELLRDRGLVLTQFDGREVEPASTSVPDEKRDWTAAMLGLTENMNRYAAADLRVKGLGGYRSLVPDPYGYEEGWTYIVPPAPPLDIVLTEQIRSNPQLRVMVTQGIFDTTSSLGSTEELFSQLDIPPGRVTIAYYPGGHMLYSDLAGLKKFTADVRAFVTPQPLNQSDFTVTPAQ
jgi:carboxypeptidase C (cathepsin A)